MIISGKQVNKKCYGRGVNYRLWRHRSARLSGENTIFANFAALSARRLRRHLQVCRECELRSLLARAKPALRILVCDADNAENR